MPRIISIIFICLAFTLNNTNYIKPADVFDDYDGVLHVHTNIATNIPYTQVIPNGKAFILSTSLEHIDILFDNINYSNIKGYTVFLKTTDLQSVLNKLGLQYFKNNNNEILAYSSLVPFSLDLDGEIYNIQIVKKSSQIVIGFPVILGSY